MERDHQGTTGAQHTELQLDPIDGQLTGMQSGEGLSSPITDVRLKETSLRWVYRVTKPLKLKVDFTGVVTGDRIEGKCKAGFMGRYPFAATRT